MLLSIPLIFGLVSYSELKHKYQAECCKHPECTVIEYNGMEYTCKDFKQFYKLGGCCDDKTCSSTLVYQNDSIPDQCPDVTNAAIDIVSGLKNHDGRYPPLVIGEYIIHVVSSTPDQPKIATFDDKDTFLVCFHATAQNVVWSKSSKELWPGDLLASRDAYLSDHPYYSIGLRDLLNTGMLRNTPFPDAEHGLVWVTSAAWGSMFIGSVDIHTGNMVSVYDLSPDVPILGNSFDPDSLVSPALKAIRAGVVVKYEDDKPYAYFGMASTSEYSLRGALTQDDVEIPGIFGISGSFHKYDLENRSLVFSYSMAPREILPNQIIPEECFRPGSDTVRVQVELYDGYEFGSYPTFVTSGNRSIWHQPSETFVAIMFNDGATFSGNDTYYGISTAGAQVSVHGSDLLSPATGTPKITKDLKRGFDLTGKKFEAWGLNYYGASVWNQGIKVEENEVVFSTGNGATVPIDEALALEEEENTMLIDMYLHDNGKLTLAQLEEKHTKRLAFEKSPRGKRFHASSVVSLNRFTGRLEWYQPTMAYDVYYSAMLNPNYLQPGDQPFRVALGTDSDSVMPEKFESGKWCVANKGGYAFIIDSANASIANDDVDGGIVDGVRPTTIVRQVGWPGKLGGANYGIATWKDVCFSVQVNYDRPKREPRIDPSGPYNLFWNDIPRKTGYLSALHVNGTVLWELPLGMTYATVPTVHDDLIWVVPWGVYQGGYYALAIEPMTGKIVKRRKLREGAAHGPVFASDDEFWIMTGVTSSFDGLPVGKVGAAIMQKYIA
jgi:hypothetical protein